MAESPAIADLADALVARGLGVPAIFMLEMQKPLSGLVAAGGAAALPILGALIGRQRCERMLSLFGSAEQLEALIAAIEAREQERGRKAA